jgi:hypothetical protein
MAVKFMQSLDPQVYSILTKIAKQRGITMQELIRAVIVPDWMRNPENESGKTHRTRRTSRHSKQVRRLRAVAHA